MVAGIQDAENGKQGSGRMKKRFFITSTGTGIGKTFTTAALARQAKAMKRSVMAYKPVISGFDPSHPEESDTGILLQSMDMPLTPENIERVSPWRFTAPLAPSMAARQEGRTLDFDALTAWSRKTANDPEDVVLVEGVGGVMVPLTGKHLIIDWIAALDVPVFLVAGSYLGTLSHTLTALAALAQRRIPLHAVIVSETPDSAVPLDATVEELSRWTRLPIAAVKRRAEGDWHDVKELRPLLA